MEGRLREHGPRTGIAVAAVIIMSGLGCNAARSRPEPTERMAAKTIQQVQEEHTGQWMAMPGVVGTAIGQSRGKPCILILTAAHTARIRETIPATVDGYPIVVQYTGEIRALDDR